MQKLRRMDAMVHIFYEIAGTGGAFCTALALIPRFGNNMSFIITPPLFCCAAVAWWFVSNLNCKSKNRLNTPSMPRRYAECTMQGPSRSKTRAKRRITGNRST